MKEAEREVRQICYELSIFSSVQPKPSILLQAELIKAAKEEFLSKKKSLLSEIRLSKRELTPQELLLLEEDSEEDDEEVLPWANVAPISSDRELSAESDANILSHVALPSQEEINQAIVEQKKKLLVERLAVL